MEQLVEVELAAILYNLKGVKTALMGKLFMAVSMYRCPGRVKSLGKR
jgi:hypothetical protein